MRGRISEWASNSLEELRRKWFKFCTWVHKKLDRIRGVENRDPEVGLRTLAPRPPNDEPDNPI